MTVVMLAAARWLTCWSAVSAAAEAAAGQTAAQSPECYTLLPRACTLKIESQWRMWSHSLETRGAEWMSVHARTPSTPPSVRSV